MKSGSPGLTVAGNEVGGEVAIEWERNETHRSTLPTMNTEAEIQDALRYFQQVRTNLVAIGREHRLSCAERILNDTGHRLIREAETKLLGPRACDTVESVMVDFELKCRAAIEDFAVIMG